MNILPIKMHNTSFKSYVDDGIIAYDDSVSQAGRKYIREHYSSWYLPYQSIYDNSHRMSEYQIKQLTNDWEKYHDIQLIDKDNNIYRGQTLVEKPYCIYNIKNKGVKTVVDLVGYGSTYEQEVKEIGLDYFEYNIFDNWWNTNIFDEKHIEKLVQFLKKMQEGNIYIGCQHGANDTDIAFILNDFFNPLLSGKVKTKIPPNDSDFPIKLNTIYDQLSKSHKQQLGWTKDFEKKLITKLISI